MSEPWVGIIVALPYVFIGLFICALSWAYDQQDREYEIKAARKHKRVLRVIKFARKVVPNAEYRFTNGLCFKFYILLNIIFSEGEPYHDSDHVITRIGDRFYDITGEVSGTTFTRMKVDSMYRTEWDRFSKEV